MHVLWHLKCISFKILTAKFFDISRFGARGGGGLPLKKFGNPGERLRKKKWDLSELPKFEKNFYVEHPEVARLTPVSGGGGGVYTYLFTFFIHNNEPSKHSSQNSHIHCYCCYMFYSSAVVLS